KDRQKTRQAIKSSLKTLIALAPAILAVILLIGLIYGFFADKISLLFGASGGLTGFFLIAIIGSIIHLPALLAFPLAGSFWAEGATVSSVAVFITTLTMIGFVTLPLEIKTMGKKFAIYRNLFSFIFALVIALLMGVIL
ncbi:MAG: permease, partial [Candidatus Cloacimonas sp. SDB]